MIKKIDWEFIKLAVIVSLVGCLLGLLLAATINNVSAAVPDPEPTPDHRPVRPVNTNRNIIGLLYPGGNDSKPVKRRHVWHEGPSIRYTIFCFGPEDSYCSR